MAGWGDNREIWDPNNKDNRVRVKHHRQRRGEEVHGARIPHGNHDAGRSAAPQLFGSGRLGQARNEQWQQPQQPLWWDGKLLDQSVGRDKRKEFKNRDQNRAHPFVGAPGPGPLIQGRRDREAAEAYLYEYLAYSNLTDDTEGIVKCNIYASHSNHLPAGVLKALRAFMEDKLRHELSSTTWSRMLEQYCLHVAPQQDDQLKECFMKALHDNHGMFQKLNCPKHLEKLEVDETYAPLLVSLLLELLSRLDWMNNSTSLL